MVAAREPSADRPTTAAMHSVRPLSPALVCLVSVVIAVAWLGAVFANVAPLDVLPVWLRGVARTPLPLAVPALVIPALFVLLAWPRRVRPAQHARSLYAAQALALVVVALPALLPFSPALLAQAPDLHLGGMILFVTTALRPPGLSLGVALAMADPLVVQRARSACRLGPSPRALAGIAFGVTVLAAGILVTALVPSHCTLNVDLGQVCALAGTSLPVSYPSGIATFAAVGGLVGVWLGYALGASLAQADHWT